MSNKARVVGTELRFGFLFGLMVEKGSEYDEGDPPRYYTYRVVFRGHDAEDQKWGVAVFQEMASTPTTVEASRYCDFLSTLPGKPVEGRDVQQAHLQVPMEGSPTYICLPKELWTGTMHQKRCPVVFWGKALYAHKNAGFFWMKFCDKSC